MSCLYGGYPTRDISSTEWPMFSNVKDTTNHMIPDASSFVLAGKSALQYKFCSAPTTLRDQSENEIKEKEITLAFFL